MDFNDLRVEKTTGSPMSLAYVNAAGQRIAQSDIQRVKVQHCPLLPPPAVSQEQVPFTGTCFV